ncbi:ABC-2 type transport system ATP-binding protein [Humibacillus xanthopallidus]|uniref:ABC-2 type transport system ATP-binding protein n=1 Tax=Humibacillus xanthopallidus TaxID=412689 RepID=A0A543PVI4_9MICO|nr:ABC transporter ATP-binding protein [Humibacillus xanthopallidus]TQN48056.1 ABC-2 type transport system ATP-binding protein [Humibacillus xanthopallidus]
MTAAVTLSDVRRRFGAVDALDGLSWHAPSGAVTAVLGPNGAGKTTAIECAVGLQRPDSGTVRVLDTDPGTAGPDHRARVGVMLQSGGLPNGAKPIRLLAHLARFYAEPADVHAVAARLGVPDFAGTTVRRLSGGQKQRLALAAALLGRPDVLFLDEPVAGLDPHGRLDVWDLIRELRDEGTTIVVTTHSFEEAERLADHLVIMSAGRTVAEGALADVVGAGSLEELYFSLTRKGAA